MVSNIGRNVAPEEWQDFGSSGSIAQNESWINPTAIDMTQYDTLLIELDPADGMTSTEIEISLRYTADSASPFQWGSPGLQDMVTYVNENLQQSLTADKKTILSFGSNKHTLLGMDSVFVNIQQKNASAKEMTTIKYRRVGFHPAG